MTSFRRTRRRRYVEELDVMEVLYRVYVGAIAAAIGFGVLAGAIHEVPADASALESIRVDVPPVIGIAIALAVLAGLRSGARGGPLAIEAAEVQYTLLAPIDRGRALRSAAFSQLRIGAIAGAVLGAVVGNFAFRRLSGSPAEWIACLALFGALIPIAVLGAALFAAGARLRPLLAAAAGLALVGWSALDIVLGSTTSPATMLGELATLPLQSGGNVALAAAGAAIAIALVWIGLRGIGGLLLEAARRRAALAAELRFTASVGDLRTVVLLRRQLASERPRRRPWLRIGSGGPHPVWRRGWQSFMRWPPARVARVLTLAAAAGAVSAAAWKTSVVLFMVPGVLLFVAALDLIEPLSQESDHPTRFELLPVDTAGLFRRHLAAPAVTLAAMVMIAGATSAAVAGDPLGLELGAVLALPLGLTLADCAAFSAINDPFAYLGLSPSTAYGIAAAPVVIAALAAGVPAIVAHAQSLHGRSPLAAAFPVAVVLLGAAAAAASVFGHLVAKRTAVGA